MNIKLVTDEIVSWSNGVKQKIESFSTDFVQLSNLKHNIFGRRGEWSGWYKRCFTEVLNQHQRVQLLEMLNQVKTNLTQRFDVTISQAQFIKYQGYWRASGVDPSLPPIDRYPVASHPLWIINQQLSAILTGLGYVRSEHSEVETIKYNFELLNINHTHPLWVNNDTFRFGRDFVARTHTTASTARWLAQLASWAAHNHSSPRIAFFTSGPVFRRDDEDATHSHQFHQLDVLAIGVDLNVSHLMWTVKHVLCQVMGPATKVRFRPTYFPFTEPSFEVDVYDEDQQRYVEILGGGMVAPAVLQLCGWETPVRAFAFGVGLERLTLVKFGLANVHDCYQNDVRWLAQFRGLK